MNWTEICNGIYVVYTIHKYILLSFSYSLYCTKFFFAACYCFYGCRCSLLVCHFRNIYEKKRKEKTHTVLVCICFFFHCCFCAMFTLIFKYLLSRDNLNASAVLITSTYACSSNRRDVTFKLWFSIANLNADCTSSVPCSNIAPLEKKKTQTF